MTSGDTIVAISSATGAGARIVVRTTGAASRSAMKAVAPSAGDEPGAASLADLAFAGLQCRGWVYTFHAPRTYTGEDLVEYHLPGNPILAGLLVTHLIGLGLRQAQAGEFTARAYFNGRLDLSAAEGVAAVVSANSEQELLAARQLMAGELPRRLVVPMDRLADTLALLEVGIDFSEEDITFLPAAELLETLASILSELRALLTSTGRLERLAREPTFVLVGRPNAGKSTLLNRLAGETRAVASPVAGTTRDVLSATVALKHGLCRVVDMAGLDDSADASVMGLSALEQIRTTMQSLALRTIEAADFVLLVRGVDDGKKMPPALVAREPHLLVVSKSDLASNDKAASVDDPGGSLPNARAVVHVSALAGVGLDQLMEEMDRLAFGSESNNARLSINLRHVGAVDEAIAGIERAVDLVRRANIPLELLAAEIRGALTSLGDILGQVSPDDVLGKVFSRFCIGK